MMQLGCRAHDFGRMSGAALANRVREAGFETVQLALTKAITGVERHEDVTPGILNEVREGFEKAGVGMAILGCYVEPSVPDRGERLRQVGYFMAGLDNAARLGIPVVGTETTWFDPVAGTAEEREAAYANLKDSVLRMVEHAEKRSVTVCIEPVTVHTLNSAELARRLLDEVGSKRLGIIFDPVNMVPEDQADRQEEIFRTFTDLLGRDIRIIHVKDMAVENGEKVWRGIGEGVIRQRFVFDWLLKNLPDVPLIREEVMPESAAADLAAMRALAGR